MRILHCPTDVGGNAWTLSRAERELGLDSTVMVFRGTRFKLPADINLNLDTLFLPLRALARYRFFQQALRDYDVFHFNFGSSILDSRWLNFHFVDLPILRRAGKGIIVTFQGCDVRQKMFSRRTFPISACRECTYRQCTAILDRLRQARVAKVERFAHHHFVLNPDLMHFSPRAEFLPYASVDLRDWRALPVSTARTIRVVHSPTDRSIKGTHYVLQAIEQLKAEGLPVELVLIEGLSRDEARQRYEAGDVFVDQLLIGWYGSFGVEAMALGRPVLCYIREPDLRFVPAEMAAELPVVRTTPRTLTEDLRRVVLDATLRRDLGERGRAYVEKWHDPLKIAARLATLYARLGSGRHRGAATGRPEARS